MFSKPKAAKLIIDEIDEAERNLVRSTIAQQQAVTAISKAEANLMICNAELSYYTGLVSSLKRMRDDKLGVVELH